MKLFTLFLLFDIIFVAVIWAQKNKVTIQKVDCKFDLETISNVTCKFKGLRNKVGIFSFAATMIRAVNQASLDIQIWDKNSANIFSRGSVHLNMDLCALDLSENNLVMKFVPFLRSLLKDALKPCPLNGTLGIYNCTIDSFDSVVMNPFAPTSDHRMEYKFIDTTRKLTYFQIDVYWHFKGKTLSRRFT